MGSGYWLTEDVVYDEHTGEVLSDRTWNYHVPLARDIPQDFRVYMKKKSYSNPLILGAKGLSLLLMFIILSTRLPKSYRFINITQINLILFKILCDEKAQIYICLAP